MSDAAEHTRKWTLKTKAHAAVMLANRLGAEIQAKLDLGAEPDAAAVRRFEEAYAEAERLQLEYTLSLDSEGAEGDRSDA